MRKFYSIYARAELLKVIGKNVKLRILAPHKEEMLFVVVVFYYYLSTISPNNN